MGVNPSEVCMSPPPPPPKILKYSNKSGERSENNVHYENEENRVCLFKLQADYISCSTAVIYNCRSHMRSSSPVYKCGYSIQYQKPISNQNKYYRD